MGWGASRKTLATLIGAVGLLACRERPAPLPIEVGPLPTDLAGTGLYADWATRTIAPGVRSFTPQYPLWSDGAQKRRWIRLPAGAQIDASSPDEWQFPVGTKLWKEFDFGGPVETRFMERTPTGWRFATYLWGDDGKAAEVASSRGVTATAEVAAGVRHRVPGESDCRVCHENSQTPVLGFSALQLSTDRDENAAHREVPSADAVDLRELVDGGWLRGFRGSVGPRISARTTTERAALGYLHANCGTCHRGESALSSLGMLLASSVRTAEPQAAIATTVDQASRLAPERMRIASGAPERSVVVERMRSRSAAMQMPPLGTQVVDEEGARLVAAWIAELPQH